MRKKKYDSRIIISWVTIVVFFIAMMFIFGVLDDKISSSIFNNDEQISGHQYDLVVSAIGATMLVLPIFFALQGLIQRLLITKRLNDKNTLYWALNAILIVICMIVNFWSMIHKPHNVEWSEWTVQIVFGVFYLTAMVLYDLWFWNNARKDEVYISNHFWLALRAVIFLVTIFVVVNAMKPIFGRPRPIQVLKGEYKYHYAFEISSYTNPRPLSFPSGHAISAMSIFALTLMYFRKPGWKHYSINTGFGILVALVCIARIVGLHHWATDTLMSCGIGALAYSLYMKLFNNKLIQRN